MILSSANEQGMVKRTGLRRLSRLWRLSLGYSRIAALMAQAEYMANDAMAQQAWGWQLGGYCAVVADGFSGREDDCCALTAPAFWGKEGSISLPFYV